MAFPTGKVPQVHVEGIAIDPRLEYVYDKPLVGRTLSRVPIGALLDASLSSRALGERVKHVAQSDLTHSLKFDTQGTLCLTSLEWNAITPRRPDGRTELLAGSIGFQWPDTIAIGPDVDLLFSNA